MNRNSKQSLQEIEEIIETTKRDLSPFWFGSEPLLAGIASEGKIIAYPLSPKVISRDQIFLFIDPTAFSNERAPEFLREWRLRYNRHKVDTILVICSPYKTLQKPERIQDLVKKYSNSFTLTLDVGNLIAKAFSVSEFPKAFLLSKGKVLFEKTSEENFPLFEIEIQNYLRKNDPGLPLLPKFQMTTPGKKDTRRIEFSENTRDIKISGNWVKQGELIITSDPNASLSMMCIENFFSIIARSGSTEGKSAEISIEINELPPDEEAFAKDLQPLDDGRAIALIREARTYHLLTRLPSENQKITLKFLTANHCPIELFGLRFGQSHC